MGDKVTGGCKCGNIRYEGETAEGTPFRCYCRDCQHLTGTGHSEMFPLVTASFTLTGSATEYQMTGDSGQPTWSRFCPKCGSPLTRQSNRMKHMVYVHAASLDDPGRYTPGMVLYATSAQPWDEPPED